MSEFSEKWELMEKADAKSVVDLCVSLDPTITALINFVDKILDPELKKEYRDAAGMLMFHSAMIVFMMEKLYPELNPDL